MYEKLNTHTHLQKRNLMNIKNGKFKRVITKFNLDLLAKTSTKKIMSSFYYVSRTNKI